MGVLLDLCLRWRDGEGRDEVNCWKSIYMACSLIAFLMDRSREDYGVNRTEVGELNWLGFAYQARGDITAFFLSIVIIICIVIS